MDSESDFPLGLLPDLALITVAKHLSGSDLLHFTHTWSKVFNVVGRDNRIWRDEIGRQKLDVTPVVKARAAEMPVKGCDDKRLFFCLKMILANFTSGACHLASVAPCLGRDFVVSEDNIFWLDWPEVRSKDVSTRINARKSPVMIIYEYDGIERRELKHLVRVPEPLKNGHMAESRQMFRLIVDSVKRLALIAIDDTPFVYGDDGGLVDETDDLQRRLIAVELGGEETKSLWMSEHLYTDDEPTFLHNEKVIRVTGLGCYFTDLRNLNWRTVAFPDGFFGKALASILLVSDVQDHRLVIFDNTHQTHDRGIVVDCSNESVVALLKMSGDDEPPRRGVSSIHVGKSSVAAFFFQQPGVVVWRLDDGQKTQEIVELPREDEDLHFKYFFQSPSVTSKLDFVQMSLVWTDEGNPDFPGAVRFTSFVENERGALELSSVFEWPDPEVQWTGTSISMKHRKTFFVTTEDVGPSRAKLVVAFSPFTANKRFKSYQLFIEGADPMLTTIHETVRVNPALGMFLPLDNVKVTPTKMVVPLVGDLNWRKIEKVAILDFSVLSF